MTSSAAAGPLSPRHRLRRLDGRTREAQFLKRTEAELLRHLGGAEKATVPQRILIRRVAADLLRLELLDVKAANGEFTELDGRVAHALRNSVRLALREIGLEAAEPPPKSLREHIAERDAEASAR
ncbi:MAG TPA: hypothetical protein VGU20_06750 [Stellaceae bacterium]|nr:hypothetical protein [Stellaceae bacterium]